MANKTIYIKDEDEVLVKRASKLLQFHEDKALGTFLVEECRKIIKKYEPTDQEVK